MASKDIINNVMMDEEGIDPLADGSGLTIPGVLLTRRRVARALQREVIYIWNLRDWPWKQLDSIVTITVPAYNPSDPYSFAGALPADFQSLGKAMSPQLALQPTPPLVWVPQATMNYLLEVERRQGTPNRYSIMAQTFGTGVRAFYIYPLQLVATDVILPYERTPPAVVDDDDPDSVGTDELFLIPSQYHESVLYEGVVMRLMKDKGSAQVSEQAALYKEQVKEMIIQERPGREAPHRVVPFGVSARGRGR